MLWVSGCQTRMLDIALCDACNPQQLSFPQKRQKQRRGFWLQKVNSNEPKSCSNWSKCEKLEGIFFLFRFLFDFCFASFFFCKKKRKLLRIAWEMGVYTFASAQNRTGPCIVIDSQRILNLARKMSKNVCGYTVDSDKSLTKQTEKNKNRNASNLSEFRWTLVVT